ncbi:MAG: HAMP domain-containing sensor histidine kinase, partial [Ferruginibacter sp.]
TLNTQHSTLNTQHSTLNTFMSLAAKPKKFRTVFIMYWLLLAYIVAALIWWFIALNRLNTQMADFKFRQLKNDSDDYAVKYSQVEDEQKRKGTAYIGEGSIFLLLILGGAVFVFKIVRKQLKQTQEQQNFMMAITHELKTPIAIAKLNLETLLKRKLDETRQQRIIETALQETNRMNSLCNNLLLSSQMEAGGYQFTKEEINFTELVSNCCNDFINRFPKKTIHFITSGQLFIKGDMFLLQIAINNLIDNAIKYSPKETAVEINLKEVDNHLILQVADNGKGIPDAEKKMVFKKFFRSGNEATKNSKGTGLGLYLTKKIMQQHKANIFVTDNQPTGSIFTIEVAELDT